MEFANRHRWIQDGVNQISTAKALSETETDRERQNKAQRLYATAAQLLTCTEAIGR